ncbi:MAG: right-handed parallel beta-helix repeat-containing protein [Sphingobacteriales bacterium]|nr:MAG: right-handed parallel beta-helix repeat-containing protein [Sphingobacteriales bacterium]
MKAIFTTKSKSISINSLIVVLCLMIHSFGINATVRYVKPIASGTADGSSWDNAHSDIQTMINASSAGDSVWVAAGEYKPNSYPANCVGCNDSRHYSFWIKGGIRLFGNFVGTETDITQRDFSGNTTILNGDLNGDDIVSSSFPNLEISGNDENVYHVILVSDINTVAFKVIIDGFTIKNGNSNIPSAYTVNGNMVTMNEGGGIYVQNQQNLTTNCVIINNSALFGGGVNSYAYFTTISNNIIVNNISVMHGGGIHFNNITGQILNNSIIGNLALNRGGAVYSIGVNTEIGYNEIVGNNSGNDGGGLCIRGGTSLVYLNVITDNYAANNGGAIFHELNSITIRKNIIAYNAVGISGGGLYLSFDSKTVENNVIYNNSAEMNGGGLYIDATSNFVTNNTIIENIANNKGGGIYVNAGSNNIRNNIFSDNWLNTEQNVISTDLFLNGGTNTFQNNILQLDSTLYTGTNYNLGATAQGNLFAQDPMFLNNTTPEGEDLIYFTGDDGLRLQTNSPAINAGTLINAPTTDILGTFRDTQPDIGAYEHGVFVGIQPNQNGKPTISLDAFPNPATESITFTFTTPTTDITSLILYAIDGKNKVSLYKGTTQANETNTVIVYTNNYTPGIYCAALRCGTGMVEHRTIIIK